MHGVARRNREPREARNLSQGDLEQRTGLRHTVASNVTNELTREGGNDSGDGTADNEELAGIRRGLLHDTGERCGLQLLRASGPFPREHCRGSEGKNPSKNGSFQ